MLLEPCVIHMPHAEPDHETTIGVEALYSLRMRGSCKQNGQLMAQKYQLAAFLPGKHGKSKRGIARKVQTTKESNVSGCNVLSFAWTA